MDTLVIEKHPLVKYGYVPGNYHNTCHECNTVFEGDKRAVCCETCATSLYTEDLET